MYVLTHIHNYIHVYVFENTHLFMYRETMGLEGGFYLYHQMTPPPNSLDSRGRRK